MRRDAGAGVRRLAAVVASVLMAGLVGCGEAGAVRVLQAPVEPRALNQPLVVRLDGPVDPLSVTSQSVGVVREDGRPLACRLDVVDGAVAILLEVGPELLADPPARAVVSLAGRPSLHALARRDGRRLGARVQRTYLLRPELHAAALGPPRLVETADRAAPVTAPLTLTFLGPLDPVTVTSAGCPAYPVAEGLALQPLEAEVTWRCVGQRFEVRLEWARPHGELRLDLRRCTWRGLHGAAPDPAPRITVAATTGR